MLIRPRHLFTLAHADTLAVPIKEKISFGAKFFENWKQHLLQEASNNLTETM